MSSSGRNETDAWTILKTLNWTTDYFKRRAIDTPRMDAEILLAHVLGCERIDLYVRYDQPLNDGELADLKSLIKRRATFEPIAYITGVKEFWSLLFQVSPAVLIPRPDTERLVEAAIEYLSDLVGMPTVKILELGVGSGAISVAIANELRAGRFLATDRSWPAIRVARNNARRNGVDHYIHFLVGDWLSPLSIERGQFDMIVSNPPYVAKADIDSLSDDIRRFEPLTALDGGADGMDNIKAILAHSHRHLRTDGVVMLEIGYDQKAALQHLVRQLGNYSSIRFLKDYSGHDRVAVIQK